MPACYVEGRGLTLFKIVNEYLICLTLAAALLFLIRRRERLDADVWRLMGASIGVMIASELAFTGYVSVYGFFNMLGHLLRIVSLYLTYQALIRTGLSRPYDLLFRDLKQNEQALRRSEDKYRHLVENLNEGIWAIDRNGLTTFVNPRMAEMLGYSAREMIGRHLHSFMDEQAAKLAEHYMERRRQGIREQHDFEFLRKDGRRLWATLETNPLLDEQNNFIGALAAVMDVTDRRQAEQDRQRLQRKSEAQRRWLQAVLDHVPAGICVLAGRELRLTWANNACGAFLAGPGADDGLVGLRLEECLAPEASPALITMIRRAAATGNACVEDEMEHGDPEGQRRFWRCAAVPLGAGQEDQAQDLMLLLTDVTDQALTRAELEARVRRRTAELAEALEQTRQAQREVVEISELERQRIGQDLHDSLGQTLTGLAMLSKVLAGRLAARSAPEADSAAEISRLLKQTVAHAREVAHGLSPLEIRTAGLNVALESMAATVSELYGIDCGFRGEGTLPLLSESTASHLYRIAQEAVSNAIRHARARRVAIALRADGAAVALTVDSDGLELPARLDRTKGLGLRIMRYRAAAIGASLAIKRGAQGEAVVTCRLPAAGGRTQPGETP